MALDMSVALKITAGVQGEQGIDRLNSKLTQVGRQGEMSARQIAQAYRQLPAQLQDVAVSLAGGQNPLMVLLQQGSQVSTQFGGMGNAIRGIAALITPAKLAFTGLAGAIGAMGVAAFQGYQESIQLQRQLAVTGNYAGLTADSFERAAARIQLATGATAAASRQMLMGAAGSGAFGPSNIDAVTQAMTRLQRLTGDSTEDIVKMFAGMSKGVADWAVQANQSYNFLSVEQYKYIRQLEEQGNKEQAMLVVANTLNDSLKTRTVQLGYVERAWKGITEAASGAWSSMMNLGRPDTLAEQIATIEAKIRNAQEIRTRAQSGPRGGVTAANPNAAIAALEAQLEALKETARLEAKAADETARRASATQKAIADEIKAEQERKRVASEAQSLEQQRATLIQGLRNDLLKLSDGEAAVTIERLKSLGATQKQIEQARELITQTAAREQQLNQEKDRKQVLERLNEEVSKLVQSEEALTVAKLRSLGASDAEIAQAQELIRQKAQIAAADRELEQATKEAIKLDEEAKRKKDALKEAGKRVYDETRTPAEKLNIEISRLNDLLDQGAIDWDTYGRAVFKAQDEFEGVKEKGKDAMQELTRAVEGWGREAANTFVQFAFEGKATFTDFVNSILKDIARMLVYQNITKPLFGAISSFVPFLGGGAAAGASGLTSLFGFANGGIMTSGGLLPLNKYAAGGIARRPQLALFGEGRMPEAYVPLPDGRTIPVTMQGAGAGETNVVVNVNMESGQTQAQADGQRGTDLGLVIASVVKQELINQRRPGGLLAA